jgi:isopentenyl-diphosphate delta-isomerase
MDKNIVIAVDSNDVEVGYYDKMTAHVEGILHRAVSVLIFNSKNEWLIQQRAGVKYHSALLWSNTACSHPMKGENTKDSAERRLQEEMGLDLPLEFIFSFQYRAEFDNGLIENELDHVFIGRTDDNPVPNPDEVADFRWVTIEALEAEIANHPENFTAWFKLLVPRVKEQLLQKV